MNKGLKDHGPKPFVVDVEKLTIDNNNYRTVIWTGKYMQMTVMSIPPGEDIGLEIHKDHDQFLRIEKGEGIVQMGDAEDNLDFQEKVGDDFAILIPAGKWHNLVNTNTEPLKLYSIYSPVEHPKNTVHKTRQAESTKHYNGGKLSNHTNINMKFNKEKTKKFASGGKTPQEIMAEARRNQQMYRDEIANAYVSPQQNWSQTDRDVYNANIAGPTPTPTLNVRPTTMGSVSNRFNSALNWDNLTFDQAFAKARRAGLKEFTYKGERIAVKLEDDKTYDGGTLPEVVITGTKKNTDVNPPRSSSTTQENSSTRVVSQQPPLEKRVKSEIENRGRNGSEVQAPDTTSYPESVPLKEFIKGPHQNFIKLYLGAYENRYKDNPTTGSRVFMSPASIWVARLYDRYYNTKSQHRSQNPRYYQQGGQLPAYQQGGQIPTFQQGGVLQNSDELYADFAIRLLSSLGLSEDEILVNGELNPQYSEMVINSINEVDTPEFWNAYVQNPDQIVAEYINSKSPQEDMGTETSSTADENSDIEFARKGAALKQLRKNKKALTCKCGCKMISKRKGGKLVTKCSCGCKN